MASSPVADAQFRSRLEASRVCRLDFDTSDLSPMEGSMNILSEAFVVLTAVGMFPQLKEPTVKQSFAALREALPSMVQRSALPRVLSPDEKERPILYSRLVVARLTSESTAKISIAVHMRDSPDDPEAVVSLQLVHYDGKWTVGSHEYSSFYRKDEENDKVLKLILLIDGHSK
jgi:hypothetical protein